MNLFQASKLSVLLIVSISISACATPVPSRPIAFLTDWDLYTVKPDGSDLMQLTRDLNVVTPSPSWSPSGRQLAFWALPEHSYSIYDLYSINADGSNLTRLAPDKWEGWSRDRPVWSPSGSQIAFVAGRWYPEDFEVYIINADGSGLTRLTHNTKPERDLAWSLDGKQIAFVSWSDKESQIYIMDDDGSNRTRLTNNRGVHNRAPVWSPDGRRIAFICGQREDSVTYSERICIIDADGSGLIQLPYVGNPITHLAWSPDGKRMVFDCWCRNPRSPGTGIYVMKADGSDLVLLNDNKVSAWDPTWSPDGRQIAFLAEDEEVGFREVYVMNADGSDKMALTHNGAHNHGLVWWP